MLAEQSNLYKKFTKDTILAGIATAALGLRGLVLIPILSKTLGAEAYGIWSQIQVIIPSLVFVALLQLGSAMYRFLPAETNKDKISAGFFSILAVTSLTSVILSVLVFILAEPIAAAVFGGAQAAPFVKLAAFLVLLTTLDEMIRYYFVTFRQIAKYSIFYIAQIVGEVALVAYLVFSGFGLYGAIAALLVIRAVLFIIGFLVIKPQIKLRTPSLSVIKPYLSFSLPLVSTGLCYWIWTSSDRYTIGHFLGIEAVGIYSAAYALGTMIEFFYYPLSIILTPSISYLYDNNKIQEVKTHLKYTLKLYLLFAIPGAFGVSILAKSVLVTLATPEFATGWTIVAVIALGTVLLDCGYIFSQVLFLFKKTKAIGLIYIASATINLVMNIILVPVMGILGAAISALATFMIMLVANSIISFKQLSFEVDWKFIAKAIISALIMGAVLWALSPTGAVNILISIVVGAIIYFAVLMLLRGFTKQEYNLLKDVLRYPKN
ncbi:MAG: flippase [Dehalococcoidia bacterium]